MEEQSESSLGREREPRHCAQQVFQVDGLGEMFGHAGRAHRGDNDDGDPRKLGIRLKLLEDFPAAHDRHHQVEEHHVRPVRLLELAESLHAVRCADYFVPLVAKHFRDDLTDRLVVVYDENRAPAPAARHLGAGPPACGLVVQMRPFLVWRLSR